MAQIASDVGLEVEKPLLSEVEALGQRLEDVRETLSVLADTADKRAINQEIAQTQINHTKNFIDSIQQVSFNYTSSILQLFLSLKIHFYTLQKNKVMTLCFGLSQIFLVDFIVPN